MEDTSFALPVTPKQFAYARSLALKNQTLLPWEVQQDRRALSSWIDAQARLKPVSALDQLPSSKQVAFAERLARIKRRAVPGAKAEHIANVAGWADRKGRRYRHCIRPGPLPPVKPLQMVFEDEPPPSFADLPIAVTATENEMPAMNQTTGWPNPRASVSSA